MYEFLGFQFDFSLIGFVLIFFFAGLFGGWFVRKGSIFGFIMFFIIAVPFGQIAMVLGVWFFTLPFVIGVLIHTLKPLIKRFSQ